MRVTLRAVVDTDLPIFYAQQLDPVATELAAFPSRGEAAFMAHWNRIRQDPRVIARTITEDDEVAGNVMSFDSLGRREIGYWLGPDFWGRRIATAAIEAFLRIERTRPLEAAAVAHNIGSIRALTKCGFAAYGEDDDHVLLRLTDPPASCAQPDVVQRRWDAS